MTTIVNVPGNFQKLAIHIAAGGIGAAVFYAVAALGVSPEVAGNPMINALFGALSGDIIRVVTLELRKVDPTVDLPSPPQPLAAQPITTTVAPTATTTTENQNIA